MEALYCEDLPFLFESRDEKISPLPSPNPDKFSQPPPFVPQTLAPEISVDPSSSDASDFTRNPRYKTEICRNFKERARCIYGEQCQFAHGRRELRDVVRNNKYKTKLCQKYWVAGYCAYGPRCNFLHDEDKQMSGVALIEYGLTHKKDSRLCAVENVMFTNRSPVSFLEMENYDSLDQMVSGSCDQKVLEKYCFGSAEGSETSEIDWPKPGSDTEFEWPIASSIASELDWPKISDLSND